MRHVSSVLALVLLLSSSACTLFSNTGESRFQASGSGAKKPSEGLEGLPNYVFNRDKMKIQRVSCPKGTASAIYCYLVSGEENVVVQPTPGAPALVRALQVPESELQLLAETAATEVHGTFRGEVSVDSGKSFSIMFETTSLDPVVVGVVLDKTAKPEVLPSVSLGVVIVTTNVIAGGGMHTCVLKNGGIKCAGYNPYGQLGDGSAATGTPVPKVLPGFETGVTHLAAGSGHTCAIKDNEVYCWGYNSNGQVGDGSVTNRPRPVKVMGLPSGMATKVAAGYNFSCALIDEGVYCWGYNGYSQLGNSGITAGQSMIPVPVKTLEKEVVDIKAFGGNSANHACAIKVDGSLYCWGANGVGQLGRGTTTTREVNAALVSGMASGVETVAIGDTHTCAIKDKELYCWGVNSHGGLGNGNTANQSRPVKTVGIGSCVRQVVAGFNFTLAVDCNHNGYGWGYNGHGEIGIGNTSIPYVPKLVMETVATDIGAGFFSGYFEKGDKIFSTGYNAYGQLGTGNAAGVVKPVASLF